MRSGVRFVVVALVLLGLWTIPIGDARAGERSMIPPGQEQTIRSFVERALELEGVGIAIDQDRIRVEPGSPEGPRYVVFHPDIEPSEELGDVLAPGVVATCGPKLIPRSCVGHELREAEAGASSLARERAPWTDSIWTIEGARSPVVLERRGIEATIDQAAAVLALALALGLLGLEARRRRQLGERVTTVELGRRFGLLALAGLGLVALILTFTSMLPLHEHASFVARSDCAIDPYCLIDPIGAWSPTSFHVLALVFGAIPYTLPALAWVSVAWTLVLMVLVATLVRTLLVELGRPRLAKFGAAASVMLLVVHPVHWRLAGSASFWPYVLVCALGAALAGLWASRQSQPWLAALGWTLAALLLGFTCGGNLVLISLAPLVWIAPMCWTRARSLGSGARRLAIAGPVAWLGFGVILVGDLEAATEHLRYEVDMETRKYTASEFLVHLDPLLLDPQISALVWAPALLLGSAWLFAKLRAQAPDLGRPPNREPDSERLHPIRLLLPLIYAGFVPHLLLGIAAGEVIGSGYPVGFLNHHWELVFCTIAVGLGTAWLIGALTPWVTRRWSIRASALGIGLVSITSIVGLAWAPFAREGWRLATETGVVERELAELDHAFAELPEHSRLVVAPRILVRLGNLTPGSDPIEINFPVGAYARAMRERGLEPAAIVAIDRFLAEPPEPDGPTLIYVGSSLRSFQPPEIEAGLVTDGLERPELLRVRDRYTLVPALEFELAAAQHEANSLRLGADRSPTTTLGFYWLVARDR